MTEDRVSTDVIGWPSRLPDGTDMETVVAPVLVTLAVLVGLATAQGGYFPTSWGWAAVPLLLILTMWLVLSGRTDAGRLDAVFIVALALFVAWIGLSIAWSANEAQSVLEFERALVVLAGCATFLALARHDAARWLVVAVLLAITVVCIYSLATRLFPAQLGANDPEAEYRLSEPIGYWNGLGIFAAMGTLLALGSFTDRSVRFAVRALAAVSFVVLPVTLYFTYSRASWVALAAGFVVTVAMSPRRRQIVAEVALLAIVPAVAVLVASESNALTHKDALLADAVREGRRVAVLLAVLSLAAVGLVVALTRIERRVDASTKKLGRVADGVMIGAIVLALAAGIVHFGSPVHAVHRAYDSFVTADTLNETGDLNNRLFTFNGNGRVQLWKVAVHSSRGHRLAGTGAGTFERFWQRDGTVDFKVRDAHGLFVETLSELGVVGLILLVVLLAVPLVAAVRERRVSFVATLAGAYFAFVLHAAVDWDWELSGVTLTALVIGCLLLTAHRRGSERTMPRVPRAVGAGIALAAGAVSVVGLIGNTTIASASRALDHGDNRTAIARAATARSWMPWSVEPWLVQGEAQLDIGDAPAARASFERAVDIDPDEWRVWLDLAATTHGSERTSALDHARSLYPRSPEIAEFESELQAQRARQS